MTTITFQVNLQTVGYPTGWEQPNRTTLDGNETVTEAANMASTRTLYLPGLLRNNYEGIGPNTITSQNGSSGYLHHGSQLMYLVLLCQLMFFKLFLYLAKK